MKKLNDIWFCKECDRYFDVRCGCEADIRFDERSRIREELLAEITKAGAIFANDHFPAGAIGYLEAAIDRVCP